MRHAILIFFVVSARPCFAEPPKFFREKQITCTAIAEAVNHFVDLKEDAAIKELEGLITDWGKDFKAEISLNGRVSCACRILFQPKDKEPLRQPLFGGLNLPFRTIPLKSWPLYPVVSTGKSFFVLSEGYMLAGHPENPKDYIKYCRTEGTFRTERVTVPTKVQAMKDLEQLSNSDAWKAIKWSDSGEGFSYTFHEDRVWNFIKSQAEKVPEK